MGASITGNPRREARCYAAPANGACDQPASGEASVIAAADDATGGSMQSPEDHATCSVGVHGTNSAPDCAAVTSIPAEATYGGETRSGLTDAKRANAAYFVLQAARCGSTGAALLYVTPNDQYFYTTAADINWLYLNLPQNAVVFSVDE